MLVVFVIVVMDPTESYLPKPTSLYNSHPYDSETGYVTYFGEGHINKINTNRLEKCFAGRDLQDGSLGKHGSPPCTTPSKLQLNYRTTITQNWQKSS